MTNLQQLANNIAAQLGAGWCGADGHHTDDAYLRGPNGEVIHLSNTSWRRSERGRVYLTGSLHDYTGHIPNEVRGGNTISVSNTKTPAQMANDIERRLLPGYREALRLCRERERTDEADAAAQAVLVDKLTAALGPTARYVEHNHTVVSGSYGTDQIDIEVRPGYGYVMVEAHIPTDLAVRFGEQLRALLDSRNSAT